MFLYMKYAWRVRRIKLFVFLAKVLAVCLPNISKHASFKVKSGHDVKYERYVWLILW